LAQNSHGVMSELSQECEPKRTSPTRISRGPKRLGLARAQTALAIRTLTGVCGSKAAPAAARVSAAQALLDRGWGKAPQPHTGEDDNDIRITLRQITEGGNKD
jgi:hypothetical protein